MLVITMEVIAGYGKYFVPFAIESYFFTHRFYLTYSITTFRANKIEFSQCALYRFVIEEKVIMEGQTASNTITISKSELIALVRSVVAEVVAGAVTDIRQGEAAIIKSVTDLNNTVLGLKNAQQTMNKTLADQKQKSSKSAVVYVNNNAATPTDLFGNNTKDPIEVSE